MFNSLIISYIHFNVDFLLVRSKNFKFCNIIITETHTLNTHNIMLHVIHWDLTSNSNLCPPQRKVTVSAAEVIISKCTYIQLKPIY